MSSTANLLTEKGRNMKTKLIAIALILSACASMEMSPDQAKVRPISETNGCQFIDTAYFEVSHPSKIHFYATKNAARAGGDAYQIMTTGADKPLGIDIHTTTIGMYRCGRDSQ